MKWDKLYDSSNTPTLEEISKFISNKLWEDLNSFLQKTYQIQPKLSYSQCSMQRGWNVKYKKRGKSLCTLYPMAGYYIALVVIGNKESLEVELNLPTYSKYTQQLYDNTVCSVGGRWMMIDVTEPEILDDVISLIKIRARQ